MRTGAGKTTTVRILATLLRPDGGRAGVLGHDVVREAAAVRRRITLAGQAATVDEDLTGWENLLFLGGLSGLSRGGARARAAGLLEAFGLAGAGGRQVKTYSGGMCRHLDLVASFLVRAELYSLDEPTTGLDLAARTQVWQIVRSAAGSGSTVLLTTQYLEEADRLADRVAVIGYGALLGEGTPAALKADAGKGTLDEVFLALTQSAEGECARFPISALSPANPRGPGRAADLRHLGEPGTIRLVFASLMDCSTVDATGRQQSPCSRSGDLELLVAEVGDELEGAAEGGDEPVKDVLSGNVAAFDLGHPGDRHAHPGGDLLLGHTAPLAHFGQPPAAGVIQHRGNSRFESLLAAGRLDSPLQVPGIPPA